MIKRLLFLCLVFIGCSSPVDYSHIKVIEAIDGDTVMLENRHLLRYIGIDTPETRVRQDGRWIEQPALYGQEAKSFNRDLVEGKYVRVEFDLESQDKYGRLLGYVFVDDMFVNEKLLREGYAVLYTYPPNVKYVDRLVSAQREARQTNRGFWGAYEIIAAQDASKWFGHIRTVRGRVQNIFQSGKAVFLNFGDNWRDDFTVVIFNNAFEYFYKQNIHPVTYYKGKTVEVTGRIREYNGPEIIVNSPQEIIIIK
ncbi:MAG: thermonuclease family protein [Candidatus Omnitrophica bacterium]|nr:thermonuclease family protein [Candidatus Omnitrophota bacterium]